MELSPAQQRHRLLKKYRTAAHTEVTRQFCRIGFNFLFGDHDAMLRHIDQLHAFAEDPSENFTQENLHALQSATALLRKYDGDTAKLDNLLNQIREI